MSNDKICVPSECMKEIRTVPESQKMCIYQKYDLNMSEINWVEMILGVNKNIEDTYNKAWGWK